MKKSRIVPVILCGGLGTRLWPLSRASFPKQFLDINPEDSTTFFQKTILRVQHINNIEDPIVICNEEYRFIVAEQIRGLNLNAKSILLEPIAKNTAPAATIAALKAIENGEDPLLLVLPSDHIILNIDKFQKVVSAAIDHCNLGRLVTFGIKPERAETGYGYIEAKSSLDYEKINGEEIIRFLEKPNKDIAEKIFLDKSFSWNSGIFFFKASVFLKEIKLRSPNIYKICKKSLSKKIMDLDFQRIDKKYFSLCENISIDNAVMEKTNLGYVLPLQAGWSDIGSWESMWQVSDKDNEGNVICGKVKTKNVKNSYLRSQERLVVGIGLEDLIIVETTDAILVAKKDQTQIVKNIVNELAYIGAAESNTHKTIYRPWGNYTSIAQAINWQVKKIIVKPFEALSLQKHKHRSEHWIIVSGTATVEINGKRINLNKNESVYIPKGSKHRLSNPNEFFLILIEVQSGEYLGEDDIERFDDKYGRVFKNE